MGTISSRPSLRHLDVRLFAPDAVPNTMATPHRFDASGCCVYARDTLHFVPQIGGNKPRIARTTAVTPIRTPILPP